MLNVEEKAIQTYNENLVFLQEVHPKVFEKVLLLNTAIEHKEYKERYALEYINDAFNILDLQSNEFFYEKGSTSYAKESLDCIDFSKENAVFEGYRHYDIPEDFQEDLENLNTQGNFLLPTTKLINYSNKFANAQKTHLHKIYKFIFFGTGLGTHLLEIHKKIRANKYYIIEDDLEIFKLSLFVTSYKELTKEGAVLVFSIFDDENDFINHSEYFLKESFIYNQYIKFFSFSKKTRLRLEKMHQIIVSQNHLNFDFVSMTKAILRPLEYLQNNYPLINLNALSQKETLQGLPVLLLGAGPSLSENMEWVSQNQGKFIIVAISTILGELEESSVCVDIIVHIHGDELALPHIQKLKDISFFKNAMSLFSAMSFPEFTDYFSKENVFIFEGNSSYKNGFGSIVTENVGSTALSLLLKMNVKNLYLLGLDFAFNQETGETHISSHKHNKKVLLQNKSSVDGMFDYELGIIKVQGNFEEEIYSTLLYKDQVRDIQKILEVYLSNANTRVYNLSKGAFIEHTEPLHIKELELSPLPLLKKEKLSFKKLFMQCSAYTLSEHEKEKLRKNIEDASLRVDILEEFFKQKTGSLEKYHYALLRTMKNLLSSQVKSAGDDLSHILTLYFQFSAPYIFDILNTKELKNPKKLMKDLNKLFVPQLIKIIKAYKKSLQEYINFEVNKEK